MAPAEMLRLCGVFCTGMIRSSPSGNALADHFRGQLWLRPLGESQAALPLFAFCVDRRWCAVDGSLADRCSGRKCRVPTIHLFAEELRRPEDQLNGKPVRSDFICGLRNCVFLV